MTPIIALGLGLSIMAGASGYVVYDERGHPWPAFAAKASPSFKPMPNRTIPNYTAPKPPQGQLFKPYKPMSVYSPRGGVDSYPAPMKPRTYIDLR